jgi:hypothetical protein
MFPSHYKCGFESLTGWYFIALCVYFLLVEDDLKWAVSPPKKWANFTRKDKSVLYRLVHQSQYACVMTLQTISVPDYDKSSLPGRLKLSVALDSAEWVYLFHSKNPVCTFHKTEGFSSSPTHVSSNKGALPFAPTVKFLCILLLNSKLSWEPHFRWLRVKYEQSVKNLKLQDLGRGPKCDASNLPYSGLF